MLLIISTLLALLTLTVTGLPTNITDLVPGNTTHSDALYNPNPLCFWGGSPQAQIPGECRCWGGSTYSGPGVDREYMTLAIDKACGEWTGGIGDPVAKLGLAAGLNQGRTSQYIYRTIPAYISVDIRSVVQVWHSDDCMGPFPISYEYCEQSLRASLDACNTGGVNGKHGGYQKTQCLTWVLDPNPSDHWPYDPHFIDGW